MKIGVRVRVIRREHTRLTSGDDEESNYSEETIYTSLHLFSTQQFNSSLMYNSPTREISIIHFDA